MATGATLSEIDFSSNWYCKFGGTYVDNSGESFEVSKDGISVRVEYQGKEYQGELFGDGILRFEGWDEGLLQLNGNVRFIDGTVWVRRDLIFEGEFSIGTETSLEFKIDCTKTGEAKQCPNEEE